MKCVNCGRELPDDAVFCSECGTKVEQMDEEKTKVFIPEEEKIESEPEVVKVDVPREETPATPETVAEPVVEEIAVSEPVNATPVVTEPVAEEVAVSEPVSEEASFVFCPNCGEKNDVDSLFCSGCGCRFGQDVFNAASDKKTDKKKSNNRKAGKTIAIVIAAVLAIGLVAFAAVTLVPKLLIGSKSADKAYDLYYVKDNSVFTLKKNEPEEVFDRIYEYDSNYYSGITYGKGPQISNDGKYLFYVKKINDSFDGDLYYRKKNKAETEEKIASSVSQFYLFSNNTVLYLTDDEKLYLADLKGNRDKISSDVEEFIISDNEDNIVFLERDGRERKLYSYDIGKKNSDKNKLATITDLCGVSKDNKTIVYMKDDSLYVLTDFENEDKIRSNVAQCFTQVDDNKVSVYYAIEKDTKKISCYDLIDDDMLSEDKNIKEPRMEDYQKVVVKDSFWGPRESIETDDSYYDDLNKYYDKQNRDNIRENLKNYSQEYHEMELFVYEVGSKEPVSLGKFDADYTIETFMHEAHGVYSAKRLNIDEGQTVKFSDYYNNGIGYYDIMSKALSASEVCVIIDNAVYTVDRSNLTGGDDDDKTPSSINFLRDGDNGTVYLRSYADNEYEVYEVSTKGGELSYDLYMDEADSFNVNNAKGVNFAFCDGNDKHTSADLYIDAVKVDSDVYPYVVSSYLSDDYFFYIKDYDDGNGDLNAYNIKTKKTEKIDSDVHVQTGVVVVDNGDFAYITDYSDRSNNGDLMLYNGKEPKRVDSDVSGFCIDLFARGYGQDMLKIREGMVTSEYDAVAPAAEAPAEEEEW